ncbi:hypothetical protein DB756_03110 [Xanthomonas perforans]|nr:hypothetical protein DB756_03110 [Xanthomonas perforans]
MGPAGTGGCRAEGAAAKRACRGCGQVLGAVCGMPVTIGNGGIDAWSLRLTRPDCATGWRPERAAFGRMR